MRSFERFDAILRIPILRLKADSAIWLGLSENCLPQSLRPAMPSKPVRVSSGFMLGLSSLLTTQLKGG